VLKKVWVVQEILKLQVLAQFLNNSPLNWIKLTSEEEVRNLVEVTSKELPCVIFKHSTTCSISSIANHRLSDLKSENAEGYQFYYLDLLAYRSVSNYIADYLQVHHESPQVILVKNGEVTYEESHLGITTAELLEQVELADA